MHFSVQTVTVLSQASKLVIVPLKSSDGGLERSLIVCSETLNAGFIWILLEEMDSEDYCFLDRTSVQ